MKSRAIISIFVLLGLFCGKAVAQSAAPKLLPFQGRLTDQNGVAVSNGVRLVQFKIYDVPTGGSPTWAGELHRTTVNGGLVNVMLGSKTSFTGVDFDKQLYLEITVDINSDSAITLADPPMLPRQAILPVVFAKEAADSRLLDGYDWSALFGTNNPSIGTLLNSKIQDGSLSQSKIQPASLTSNQISPRTINASLILGRSITSAEVAVGGIDLTNLAQQVAEALNPPGTIVAYAGGIVPSGWLLCDGSQIPRATYAKLFVAISTAWGSGDGSTTFHLPDLRGTFLRGLDGTAGRDPDKASRTQMATGGNNGNQIGSFQADNFKSHNHAMSGYAYLGGGANNGSFGPGTDFALQNITSGNTGGLENRPKNAYVNYIIKY